MKKLQVLLCTVLVLTGCGAGETDNSGETEPVKADWSELESLVDDAHIGVDLLGWAFDEEELNALIDKAKTEDKYAFLGTMDASAVLTGEHEGNYITAVWLLVPNTDYDMTITVSNYDWSSDTETGILYEGNFDAPLLLTADDALGDRNIRILAVDQNGGEFYWYPFIELNTPTVNTDYFMGIHDITDYDRLNEGDVPFYGQVLFDRIFGLQEVHTAVGDGNAFAFLWEMGVNGHNHVVYAVYDGAQVSSSEPKVFFAARPGDPDIKRSEDLMYWTIVQE